MQPYTTEEIAALAIETLDAQQEELDAKRARVDSSTLQIRVKSLEMRLRSACKIVLDRKPEPMNLFNQG